MSAFPLADPFTSSQLYLSCIIPKRALMEPNTSSLYPYFSRESARDRSAVALEPDEGWKARLRAEIKRNLLPMVKAAYAECGTQLDAAMAHIKRLEDAHFNIALEYERQDRLRAAGANIAREQRAAGTHEHQAILIIIERINSAREAGLPPFQAPAADVGPLKGLGVGTDGRQSSVHLHSQRQWSFKNFAAHKEPDGSTKPEIWSPSSPPTKSQPLTSRTLAVASAMVMEDLASREKQARQKEVLFKAAEEGARYKVEEANRRAEDARKREAQVHRQGEFMKKKAEEIRKMEAEVIKKEHEARAHQEAARRFEAELKRKDEEARRKAGEMQKYELQLRWREEYLDLRDAVALQQAEFRLLENKKRLAEARARRLCFPK
jgi:hypothetical protein